MKWMSTFEVDRTHVLFQDVIGHLMMFLIVTCMNGESIKKDHLLKDEFFKWNIEVFQFLLSTSSINNLLITWLQLNLGICTIKPAYLEHVLCTNVELQLQLNLVFDLWLKSADAWHTPDVITHCQQGVQKMGINLMKQ